MWSLYFDENAYLSIYFAHRSNHKSILNGIFEFVAFLRILSIEIGNPRFFSPETDFHKLECADCVYHGIQFELKFQNGLELIAN